MVNTDVEAMTIGVFLGSGSVMEKRIVKTVLMSQQNARNELAERECTNVTTASVPHQQRFVMETMIALIGLMKNTAT